MCLQPCATLLWHCCPWPVQLNCPLFRCHRYDQWAKWSGGCWHAECECCCGHQMVGAGVGGWRLGLAELVSNVVLCFGFSWPHADTWVLGCYLEWHVFR